MNLQKQINAIVDIILEYAEGDDSKKEKLSKYVMAVRKEHGALNKEVILLELTGTLYEGLAYGSWPWIDHKPVIQPPLT